jgi:hypothetical protein
LLSVATYFLFFQKKEENLDLYKKIINDNYRLQPLEYSLLREIDFQEIQVKNEKGVKSTLSEISNNHNLIFILNGNSCWSCVEDEFKNVSDLSSSIALVGYNIQESYLFKDQGFEIFEDIFVSENIQNSDLFDGLQVPVIIKVANNKITNMYISPKHNFEFPFFNQALK